MPPDRVWAFPAPAIGAGIERLAGYIPPPPPPPSPPPCSGTFRSWCSGDEGQYGAPVWPVVLWAQPASASREAPDTGGAAVRYPAAHDAYAGSGQNGPCRALPR